MFIFMYPLDTFYVYNGYMRFESLTLFILILLFLYPTYGRDTQYVQTTKPKALKSLSQVQFEIELESFNVELGHYNSQIKLPNVKWIQPTSFQTFVYIPNLKALRVPAKVFGCEGLTCNILIKYPVRGLVKLSAFIEWKTSQVGLVQLPIESIISPNGNQKYVFIEKNKKAIKKPINLINLNGVFGITEDISLSDDVIIFGQERLVDGESVEVINDRSDF